MRFKSITPDLRTVEAGLMLSREPGSRPIGYGVGRRLPLPADYWPGYAAPDAVI
jgi:hypothetical protein